MNLQPCPGYDQMHGVIHYAPGDIRSHLWTLYWLARTLGGRVVELGVRRGDSTRAILAGVRDAGEIRQSNAGIGVWSFDIEDVGDHVLDVCRAQGFVVVHELWHFGCWNSVEAGGWWHLPGPRPQQVDLVFVDTDHTVGTTMAEISAWSPHVRPGGVMAFHDVFLTEPPRDGVRPAIMEFLERSPGWTYEEHGGGPAGDTGLGLLHRKE